MKDANDASEPVWEGIRSVLLVCKDHEICVRSGIERVLCAPYIVCGVVNTQNLVAVEAVILETDLARIFGTELVFKFISCEWVLQKAQ